MPVQHTATQTLLISAVVQKSKSQQKSHCCKKVHGADDSPLEKELVGEDCSTRGTQAGKIPGSVIMEGV